MSVPSLKVIFAGTPEFAAAHLKTLVDSNHRVCGVYTQPDRGAGRGRKLTPSPVKQLALAHDLIVCQPETLKTVDARQLLRSFEADIMVVVAYGIILPIEILEIPRLGCINVHASLLPRWRGAAPIQRAIEAGDEQTGITIMQMDSGLDTGDMLFKSALTIGPTDTTETLHDRLMQQGSEELVTALDAIALGKVSAQKQNDTEACYAKKLTKQEASIDWLLDADEIGRKIRAFTPWPGCYISLNHQKMKIIAKPFVSNQPSIELCLNKTQPGTIISADENGLRVSCGKGSLLITSLQLPGKKMTPIAALLNAYKERFLPGQQFDL